MRQAQGPCLVREGQGERFASRRLDPFQSSQALGLTMAGTLFFAPANSELEDGHAKLVLEDGKKVTLGSVQLKFTMPRAEGSWCVQMLPGPEVTNPSILIFGADEDVPIYNSRSSNRFTSVIRKPGKDPFNGTAARGFRCPGGPISRIRIRSYQRKRLIEVPFQLKTGLGLSGGPKLKPDKEENEPDQTVKNASPNPAGFPVINEGPRRAVG